MKYRKTIWATKKEYMDMARKQTREARITILVTHDEKLKYWDLCAQYGTTACKHIADIVSREAKSGKLFSADRGGKR